MCPFCLEIGEDTRIGAGPCRDCVAAFTTFNGDHFDIMEMRKCSIE